MNTLLKALPKNVWNLLRIENGLKSNIYKFSLILFYSLIYIIFIKI